MENFPYPSSFWKSLDHVQVGEYVVYCDIFTLDQVVNQRCFLTGHTCVNKGKQWCVFFGSRGLYEIIYENAAWGPGSVGISKGMSQTQLAVTESSPFGAAVHSWLPVEYPSRVAEDMPSGAMKITQRGMIKTRKSYGSILQSVFVSMCPSVSLTQQGFDPFQRLKRRI